MHMRFVPAHLPRPLWLLLAVYFCASLLHFWHNAEYLALYPNMPRWVSRETVYLVWLMVAAPGALGLAFLRLGWKTAGLAGLALFGALGLDGLAHYTLALCSEHSWAMNATIWFEAVTGFALAVYCVLVAVRAWPPAKMRAA